MKKLFEAMRAALTRGEEAVLCLILTSSGSAPRGAGAKMAVFSDGRTVGTIGGGAVERLATEQARTLLSGGESLCQTFRLSQNQVRDIGMVCGGEVTVLYRCMGAEMLAFVEAALAQLEKTENAWLLLRLDGGSTEMGLFDGEKGLRFVSSAPERLTELLRAHAVYFEGTPGWFAEPLSRAGRAVIFGGGHVGSALVPVLAGLDFPVVVFDNRPDFAKKENYPEAKAVILGDYSDIESAISLGEEDCAIIMTPGHQADREVLLQVLRTRARYIGCIGSRAKIAKTNEFLRENGVSGEEIARVHAPIGLPIGAQTPAEIAISVAAELILHRAREKKEEKT